MSITKKFIVGAVAAFAIFGLSASSANAAYTHSTTLKQGSRSSQVMMLQQTLNMTACKVASSGAGSMGWETMYFGPATNAAVKCFQAANGLKADGVVGPMTGMKLAAVVVTDTTLPAGCSSRSQMYSTTQANVRCDGSSTNPSNPSTPSTPSTGGLTGGAADIEITSTSTDVESDVNEGEEDVPVLGFEVEADGGDAAITSVRVSFGNEDVSSPFSSERFDRYVDEVSIWMGDKKVGSADAEDFSRESGSSSDDFTGTNDVYTETIQLSSAIVREDEDDMKFYVAVTAAESIDEEDRDGANFRVALETVRFTDSTGAVLTEEVSSSVEENFSFNDASEDDELTLRSSSENPEDMAVQVDEEDSSEEELILAFNLEADEDSSDAMILDLPIRITINDSGTEATNFDDVIDTVTVKHGSDEWEAEIDDDSNFTGGVTTTRTYSLDLDDDEFMIGAGDEEEVMVYVTFNDQEGNYGEGTTVTATVRNEDIDAEGEDEDIDVEGSDQEGATLTLLVNGASFTADESDITEDTSGDDDDVATFTFRVDVSTFDEDIFIPKAGATAVSYDVINASTNSDYSGGTQSVAVTAPGADSETVNGMSTFVIDEDRTITITVTLNNSSSGTAGQYFARLNNIKFYTEDNSTTLTTVVLDPEDFESDPIQVNI